MSSTHDGVQDSVFVTGALDTDEVGLEQLSKRLEKGYSKPADDIRKDVFEGDVDTSAIIPGTELQTGYAEQMILNKEGSVMVDLDVNDSRSFQWISDESKENRVEFFVPLIADNEVTIIGPYGSIFRYGLESDTVTSQASVTEDLIQEVGTHAGLEYVDWKPADDLEAPDYEKARDAVRQGKYVAETGEPISIAQPARSSLKKRVRQPEKASELYDVFQGLADEYERGELARSLSPTLSGNGFDIYQLDNNYYIITNTEGDIMAAGKRHQLTGYLKRD